VLIRARKTRGHRGISLETQQQITARRHRDLFRNILRITVLHGYFSLAANTAFRATGVFRRGAVEVSVVARARVAGDGSACFKKVR